MLVLADLLVLTYLRGHTSRSATPPRISRARCHQPPASPLRNAAPPPLRWRTARHRRGRRAASPSSTARSQRSAAPPAGRLRQPACGAALHRSRSASGWEKTPFRVAPTGPPVDADRAARCLEPASAATRRQLHREARPGAAPQRRSRPTTNVPAALGVLRTVHSTCMARRAPRRPWNEPHWGPPPDFPLYPRARSCRVNTACGAAQSARPLQSGPRHARHARP